MLSKIILSLFVALTLSQSPIPIPINVTAMNGLWYASWVYEMGGNFSGSPMPECFYLKIVNATNQGGVFNMTIQQEGE